MRKHGRWVYDTKLKRRVAGPMGRKEARIVRDTMQLLEGGGGEYWVGGQLRPRFILSRRKK